MQPERCIDSLAKMACSHDQINSLTTGHEVVVVLYWQRAVVSMTATKMAAPIPQQTQLVVKIKTN